MREILSSYKNKRVLITGNTGFKGAWLTRILLNAGAQVTGVSLEAPTKPSLYVLAELAGEECLTQVTGDVRDLAHLKDVFRTAQPEIVFHLAAQPIVRQSYRDPVGTYETNVMGTVNLLECVRLSRVSVSDGGLRSGAWEGGRSVLNVTTDKVYENREWCYGYREVDPLDGFDPYSNSKSCSELVTHAYRNSFFGDAAVRVSTARAGNVIGGGDFSPDRIVPDCVRAAERAWKDGRPEGEIIVRNPGSTRPYQHVLEPLFAYLQIAAAQLEDEKAAGYYNVGPDEEDCVTTGELADLFVKYWGGSAKWVNMAEKNAPHEAGFLKLDCAKLKRTFGWKPVWHIEDTVKKTVEWYKTWHQEGDLVKLTERQIYDFFE